ncbi:hypothetical protein A3J20_05005 [Candidatus Gottesmanbacteria bacterium RIFCSPLOWO2_02_FULL_42_29]|uniref:Uncharacterized protein n=2 Tax=Candidatus Gottesmaniibacteriota TaxID=1752720 RepID=A0A1F6BGY8_9BACT|nr:MAG: hypothetical protein UV09_C0047G0014 [Candidatus Gottesmanbacteria bacterium GW2011_GWA2_42_18]KKS74247.1 MAG: hypothetical protein UV46_C0048G0005 [Candidatus Gottesmanbacteria bacterium GW2011_GWC2_42_8]OGG09071.1 MAG: hypothetical protein A2781_04370 [Candidatus Gottesmanbacteria bacterium RIFCSPHIGHO2_01_FULL_42_27]OGG20250.1 MAG: hypothetical protein A3E72_02355 [Candidatus Gottesmanbacteria bacterium RIFCSPHIGHO2_12_FULL_43_26]OGG32795.1 MAG: hypothetical protein A3G68_04010 [Cand
MADQSIGKDDLFHPTADQLQNEAELGRKGFIPERWQQIEAVEVTRMRQGMEQALLERTRNMSSEAFEQRRTTVNRYFGELLQPPSFEGGPYAAARWLNLHEMLTRVIDFKQDEGIVPDVDGRVPFQSMGLDKNTIISSLVTDRVQSALPEEQKLREAQLYGCFTNVTKEQLGAVVNQIATSGLTLLPESPNEHWKRIVAEMPKSTAPPPSVPLGK